MAIWTYVKSLLRHWWALMSCAAFTILAVILTRVPATKANTFLVVGTGALAVLFLIVASYRAWKEEHTKVDQERQKYESEALRNSKPCLTGNVSNFQLSRAPGVVHASGYYHGEWTKEGTYSFDAYLCNTRPRATTLREIRLDGSGLVPAVNFSQVTNSRNAATSMLNIALPDGIGVTLSGLEVTVQISSLEQWSESEILIGLENLKAYAKDSFMEEHQLSVNGSEALHLIY